MPTTWRATIAPLLAACAVAAVCAEEDAVVVKAGKAATGLVVVGGERGFGSAFCIDPNGIYVTNAHVVRGVGRGGFVKLVLNCGEASQQEHMATVIKVGAFRGPVDKTGERDLALLKINAKNPLPALEFGNVEGLVETDPFTAFGYPFGKDLATDDTKYPNISVSTGKITSLRKDKGNVVLLQLDGALNPGNSGGPVLGKDGKVLGVVWAGVPGAVVNFAIPASAVQKFLDEVVVQFAPPRVEAKDKGKPLTVDIKVSNLARPKDAYAVQLVVASGKEKRKVEAEALGGGKFRATFVPVPTKETPAQAQVKISILWPKGQLTGLTADRKFRAGGNEVKLSAVQVIEFQPAVKVTTTSGETFTGALAGWGPLDVDVGGAVVSVDAGKAVQLTVQAERGEGDGPVTCNVVVRLKDKVVAELERPLVIEGQPAVIAPVAVGPASPVRLDSTPGPGEIAELGDEPLTRKLPGTLDDVVLAGNGRFLLLPMKQVRKIGVFDVTTGKVERYLPMPAERCLVAGNAEKAILVLPEQNIIQRYDLATGEKELTAKTPVTGIVKCLAMGWGSKGPLLMHWAVGSEALDQGRYDLIDPITFKVQELEAGRLHNGNSFRDVMQIRASRDGTVFTQWCTSHSPGGLEVMTLEGKNLTSKYEHNSAGHVVPTADGKFICTGMGLYTLELKPLQRNAAKRQAIIPSTHPAYYLAVDRGGSMGGPRQRDVRVHVCLSGNEAPLVTLGPLTEMESQSGFTYEFQPGMPVDRRYWYIPTAQLLVTVPHLNDSLVLRRMNLERLLEKSGVDYLFVNSQAVTAARRGQVYAYQLEVKSKKGGLKFSIDGPKGMTISETGRLVWTIPATFEDKDAPVIVTITDAAGQQVFHTFTIGVTLE